MIIVVEGADNSGKTTFSEHLAGELMWPRIHPGGPPSTLHDRNVKMADQLVTCVKCSIKNYPTPVVYDRITCISDPVYKFDISDPVCESFRGTMLHYGMLVIFCRPPDDVLMRIQDHPLKPHDTEEQVKSVKKNQRKFIDLYDEMMKHTEHVKYDYTSMNAETFISHIKGKTNV
jgi:hypothetical protein